MSVKLGDTIQPIKEVGQDYILIVLALCDGDKHKAAHALQMGITTLYRKLSEYKVTHCE
ncbi:MAG: DNA-binding NtrC family response regulator [Shewanella psychromarinicola]|jgi:DNA-binding NtrC family response regulator|uniref:helix-turn-helix domain-containing protein n=1 Tax=Shewanella psychromarinicola TaxID=2487742 RepID=UPI003EEE7CFF